MLKGLKWHRVLVLSVAFAACGGGGTPEEQVRDAADEYLEAFKDGDGEKACALMTRDAKKQLVRAGAVLGGGDCERLFSILAATLDEGERDELDDLEVESLKVTGDTAVVTYKGGDPTPMRRVDGKWLIDFDPADTATDDTGGEPAAPAPTGAVEPPR